MAQVPCSWFDKLTTSGNQKPLTLNLSKGERVVSLSGQSKEQQPWNLDSSAWGAWAPAWPSAC